VRPICKRGDRSRHIETPKGVFETAAHEKQAARALLQARVEEVGTGTYVPPLQRLTFTQVGTKWLASRVRLRASTRADYQTMLDCYLFPYFGPRKYETISRLDIEQFRADLQEGVPESVLRTSPFGRPNGRAKLLSCSFV
jgi:hypothetical protein